MRSLDRLESAAAAFAELLCLDPDFMPIRSSMRRVRAVAGEPPAPLAVAAGGTVWPSGANATARTEARWSLKPRLASGARRPRVRSADHGAAVR